MTIIVICYVAVDGIAFVATFYKSYFSLILSQLFLRLRVSFLSTLPMSEQAMYRLLRHFYKKPERAHAAAPSLQIEPAALGFGLVFYGNHNFCIATHTKPIESAPISNR